MHKIVIPEEVLVARTAASGRLHRYEELVGAKSALVVVDLQNVFMLPGMPVEVPVARDIVPAVNRLATAVRAAGGRVIWIQMTLDGQRDSWTEFFHNDPNGSTYAECLRGSHGHALYAELDVRLTDVVMEKCRFSAFIQGSSRIDSFLRDAGMDTVIIVGTLTNICCESSARDAMMLNYKVVFVSDANAAITDAEHNASLVSLLRVFADVSTTDEVIGRLTSRR